MKIITSFVGIFILTISTLLSQELPVELKESVNKKQPQRDSIQWKKTTNTYEVICFSKGLSVVEVFTLFGEWRETKTPLNIESLPQAVIDAVNAKHKEVEFYDIFKVVTSDNRILYELKTDTETAGYLIRAYEDGKINLSQRIFVFEE